jgi:hypothetical protein
VVDDVNARRERHARLVAERSEKIQAVPNRDKPGGFPVTAYEEYALAQMLDPEESEAFSDRYLVMWLNVFTGSLLWKVAREDQAYVAAVLHHGGLVLTHDNVHLCSFEDVETFRSYWEAAYDILADHAEFAGPSANPRPDFDPANRAEPRRESLFEDVEKSLRAIESASEQTIELLSECGEDLRERLPASLYPTFANVVNGRDMDTNFPGSTGKESHLSELVEEIYGEEGEYVSDRDIEVAEAVARIDVQLAEAKRTGNDSQMAAALVEVQETIERECNDEMAWSVLGMVAWAKMFTAMADCGQTVMSLAGMAPVQSSEEKRYVTRFLAALQPPAHIGMLTSIPADRRSRVMALALAALCEYEAATLADAFGD